MATKIDLISSPFNDREFIYVNNDIIHYKIVPFDEYCKHLILFYLYNQS
jgi:hypothetical protein